MLTGVSRRILAASKPMTRNLNVQGGPALVHVSTGEKLVHAGFLVSAWLFIPAWVLVNMKEYKKPKE